VLADVVGDAFGAPWLGWVAPAAADDPEGGIEGYGGIGIDAGGCADGVGFDGLALRNAESIEDAANVDVGLDVDVGFVGEVNSAATD